MRRLLPLGGAAAGASELRSPAAPLFRLIGRLRSALTGEPDELSAARLECAAAEQFARSFPDGSRGRERALDILKDKRHALMRLENPETRARKAGL